MLPACLPASAKMGRMDHGSCFCPYFLQTGYSQHNKTLPDLVTPKQIYFVHFTVEWGNRANLFLRKYL